MYKQQAEPKINEMNSKEIRVSVISEDNRKGLTEANPFI
ncbi:hypothetical protein D051_3107 [Vibrio parahaemolyticus VPCR-2010]|nr:hypothetical protein A79_4240 [Vibrio parahaemolyticus AQ3810]EQM14211.1 hypothetical protein D024_0647 [Vibrio parahaemolyticus 3259]EQM43465.1 hypothetical protein D051_3107 [Vibrio parahaemolyticus VPCR-2010]ETJ89260.1 hypothetical protein D041_3519 [Vibrio parahaemolyticus EKP-008]ETT15383.1 hypothetical protein D028_2896 [Vibrio parahaemolyticus 50]ETX25902.1 hypothetical protein D037_0474 [Vibrio parahaemolyticus IDH02640]ETX73089.1 hypothetical protein D039_3588 [Vibrio parahaemolyt